VRAAAVARALHAARERSELPVFLGTLEVYCDHPGCPVRTVSVEVKEHDDVTPGDLRCPACRRPMKLHHVHTREEQYAADRLTARRCVNAQRFEKTHPGAAVPIGALLDDRLPS